MLDDQNENVSGQSGRPGSSRQIAEENVETISSESSQEKDDASYEKRKYFRSLSLVSSLFKLNVM